jgi:site-specific recombinase XerC
MHLYRPTWTASGKTYTGKVWWIEYRDASGSPVRESTKVRDRALAERVMARRRLEVEAGAVGFGAPRRGHELAEAHVRAWEASLESRGVTRRHRLEAAKYVRAYMAAASVTRLGELDSGSASEWLVAERGRGCSVRSVAKRRSRLRQFGRWLVRAGRVERDPFGGVDLPAGRGDPTLDRELVRRAIAPDELARLLRAPAERLAVQERDLADEPQGPRLLARLRVAAAVRPHVYTLAASTGLRRSELRALTVGDLDLERPEPLIRTRAAVSKARRMTWLPLREDAVAALRSLLRPGMRATDSVWPPRTFPTCRTVALDLRHAGIGPDEEGRVADFHSLRSSFASALAAAKVHPRVAQRLLRHSTMELTMRVYTDPALLDLAGALRSSLGAPLGAAGVATVPDHSAYGDRKTATPKAKRTRKTSKKQA